MKKRVKGQITVFIIIGIILLLSAATIIYFTQQRAKAPIERVVSVPEEVQKVYDYVITCVEQAGKEGLITMGAQGGYLTLPEVISRNPNAHLEADPLGVRKIPYWYYEGEDRTPSLENMQRDLALHIKQRLPECVGTFEAFKEQYDINPQSDILPVVTFTDEDVVIELKWLLDIAIKDRVVQLTDYVTSFPLHLKDMYDLATNIMESENKGGFMENLTIDLMVANPDIPLSGMEFSCGTKKWHLNTVKRELQRTLYYNLPQIRIENTNYPPPLAPERVYDQLKRQSKDIEEDLIAGKEPDWPDDAPEDAFEMNRMRFDVNAKESDLKVAFMHQENWPLFINAQPNQGGILSTAQMKGPKKYLRFMCMNQWHFAYDVIYPVKVLVRDESAFFGEGYNFQFAFPVIIEDNKESRTFFGLKRFQVPAVGTDFCSALGDQYIDIRAKGFVEGGLVAEELPDANITYQCLSQQCILGTTYSDGTGAIRLTSYLPEGCTNPTIRAEKDGYLPAEGIGRAGTLELFLTRLKRLNYSFRIYPYTEHVDKDNPLETSREEWLHAQTYTELPRGMHATITFSLANGTHDQYKYYEPETRFEVIEGIANNQLDFVYDDAQYNIDVLLFKQDLPVGGYHAENITISYEDLLTSNNLVIPVVEYRPLPKEDHQQAAMFFFLYENGERNDKPYAEDLPLTFTP